MAQGRDSVAFSAAPSTIKQLRCLVLCTLHHIKEGGGGANGQEFEQIPGAGEEEKPGVLQSMGSQRFGHN